MLPPFDQQSLRGICVLFFVAYWVWRIARSEGIPKHRVSTVSASEPPPQSETPEAEPCVMVQHGLTPGTVTPNPLWPDTPKVREAIRRLAYIGVDIDSDTTDPNTNYRLRFDATTGSDMTHPLEMGYLMAQLRGDVSAEDFDTRAITYNHSLKNACFVVRPSTRRTVVEPPMMTNSVKDWNPAWPDPNPRSISAIRKLWEMNIPVDQGLHVRDLTPGLETPRTVPVKSFRITPILRPEKTPDNFGRVVQVGYLCELLSDIEYPTAFTRETTSDTYDIFAGPPLIRCKWQYGPVSATVLADSFWAQLARILHLD